MLLPYFIGLILGSCCAILVSHDASQWWIVSMIVCFGGLLALVSDPRRET